MPDAARLERAWKLHERAQADQGPEADNAARLRDEILQSEDTTLAQLEQRFGDAVPPTGRPSGHSSQQYGFGNAWTFTSRYAAGGVFEQMMRQQAAREEQLKEEAKRHAEQAFQRRRERYRAEIPPSMETVLETLIDAYKREDSDVSVLNKVLAAIASLAQCSNQLDEQARKINDGEISSPAAVQQCLRVLTRNARSQNETLNLLLCLASVYAGSQNLKANAQRFEQLFGKKPG